MRCQRCNGTMLRGICISCSWDGHVLTAARERELRAEAVQRKPTHATATLARYMERSIQHLQEDR